MKTTAIAPPTETPKDPDQAEQAHPGHGVPSQDPSPGAQSPLRPEEAEREAKSVLAGGGMMAGAATGALIGIAVAGPVGVVVGGTVGAVAGALGGAAAGANMGPDTSGDADADAAADADTAPAPAPASTVQP